MKEPLVSTFFLSWNTVYMTINIGALLFISENGWNAINYRRVKHLHIVNNLMHSLKMQCKKKETKSLLQEHVMMCLRFFLKKKIFRSVCVKKDDRKFLFKSDITRTWVKLCKTGQIHLNAKKRTHKLIINLSITGN